MGIEPLFLELSSLSQDIFKLLIFSDFSAFFGVICKINKNYTDLRCLLEIKTIIEQAEGAGALAAYCSRVSSGSISVNLVHF